MYCAVMTQEYIGDNIAEILMINYDGSQPALTQFGVRNPETESLNNAIKFGIQQRYNEFMENKPLSYRRAPVATGAGGGAAELRLSFDNRGLEVIASGHEYSLDGMVHFSLEKLAPTGNDRDSILRRIKNREGHNLRLITLTPSAEHSARLSYPAWLAVYEQGANEDTRHCVDVYVLTDTADFRLHTSTPANFATGYHDEIGRRLATVAFNY